MLVLKPKFILTFTKNIFFSIFNFIDQRNFWVEQEECKMDGTFLLQTDSC